MDDIESIDDRPWSPEEAATLAGAVNRAPSVHNTQPWSLSMHDRVVELYERGESEPSRHDPQGGDRLLSCGAALANLILVGRRAGVTSAMISDHWSRSRAATRCHLQRPSSTDTRR